MAVAAALLAFALPLWLVELNRSESSADAAIVSAAKGNSKSTKSSKSAKPAKETKAAKFNVDTPYAAPEFVGLENWMNSKGQPVTLAGLKGKVVLIDFWTFGCINCQRTLPHVNDLYTKYHTQGFEVIGIHTPEFDSERTTANVKKAINRENIKFIVAQDNQNATWNAYRNRFWPQFYFIDRLGQVRHIHIGEGDYDNADLVVASLLAEPSS